MRHPASRDSSLPRSLFHALTLASLLVVGACEASKKGDKPGKDATDSADAADWADASDAADAADGTDSQDAADAVDGKEASDASDAVDAADVSDASDAVDSQDGADAVDVVDGLDAMDAMDATDAADAADATDGFDGLDSVDGGGLYSCCESDQDCFGSFKAPGAIPVAPLVCAEFGTGSCQMAPPPGSCWNSEDCSQGQSCSGAWACPCLASCDSEDTLGTCVDLLPGCCASDSDCDGDSFCLSGVCTLPVSPGGCYSEDDCGDGSVCQDSFVCPCGAPCFMATTEGVCVKEGAPPAGCCNVDADCEKGDEDQVCVPPGAGGSGESEYGSCAQGLQAGQCWSDADCGIGTGCKGASTCPCGVLCALPSSPGKCVAVVPPPEGCCTMDADCAPGDVCAEVAGDGAVYSACVLAPKSGKCWNDQDCGQGEACDGALICPCGSLCGVGPFQGTCAEAQNECVKDADCGGKTCIAGPLCLDFCLAGDPACCYGNTCSLCPANPPKGCSVDKECPGLQTCKVDNGCHASACGCDEESGDLICTADCQPGYCVE